jgi:hypothetical protein
MIYLDFIIFTIKNATKETTTNKTEATMYSFVVMELIIPKIIKNSNTISGPSIIPFSIY